MKEYSGGRDSIIMTREEVRAFDRWAIEELQVSGVVLMENAGRSCAELIKEKLGGIGQPGVCIFCGTGNNGGDGYVIARHLLNSGFEVRVVIAGDRTKIKGDAKINLDIWEKLGQAAELLDLTGDIAGQVRAFAAGADMFVDGIFGTGLGGEVRGPYRRLIESINEQGCPVLAIDIPSGLDCNTGKPLGTAIKAAYTVTFAAVKKGFVASKSAQEYTGGIYVASIGVEPGAAGRLKDKT